MIKEEVTLLLAISGLVLGILTVFLRQLISKY